MHFPVFPTFSLVFPCFFLMFSPDSPCFLVFFCFPLILPVFWCFSMFYPDSPCLPVFFYVFPWFSLFSSARFCTFSFVFPCFSMFSRYSLFSRAFLRFHLFSLVSPCLSCFPLFFYVFPCFLPSQSAWVNKSTHPRKFGNHVSDRPTVRPHHRETNAKFRVVCECIVFGAKTKGRPRFVKHKQLKSSVKSTQKKKKFFVSVEHRAIPQFLIFYWLCPLVWSTEIEKGRGNEKVGGKQAKLNGRGSGRELQKGDCSDEQREREQGRNRERRRNFTDEQREREQERSTERRRRREREGGRERERARGLGTFVT